MAGLCVVFDLDDTLYPEREFAVSGFKAAGRWAHGALGVGDLDIAMTRLLDAGLRGEIFNRVLADHVPGHPPEAVTRLVDAYRSNIPELTLFDDAARVLAALEKRVPLALITDGPKDTQARKVAALKLEPRFAKIALTDTFGGKATWKPHPVSFESVAAALAGNADRFVYVGDNPSKDFVAPNAMGWLSVQIARPRHIHVGIHDGAKVAEGGAPHHIIETLDALLPLLPL